MNRAISGVSSSFRYVESVSYEACPGHRSAAVNFRRARLLAKLVFEFIEGFYNPRRRHSSIGYLSPIDYERRHQEVAVDPDAYQPAVVLAAVKDKPSRTAPRWGRP